ncbi:MAG: hypothetical protein M5R40_15730 [Anaerolineae bacterium]|nr:hypothetical protein [Anaerolineae bacterium]
MKPFGMLLSTESTPTSRSSSNIGAAISARVSAPAQQVAQVGRQVREEHRLARLRDAPDSALARQHRIRRVRLRFRAWTPVAERRQHLRLGVIEGDAAPVKRHRLRHARHDLPEYRLDFRALFHHTVPIIALSPRLRAGLRMLPANLHTIALRAILLAIIA